MSFRLRSWRTLPREHKHYLAIYAAGSLWALAYLIFSPIATYALINGGLIVLWCTLTIAGGLLASTGLLFRDNLLLERLGVTFLLVGPLAFLFTQLGLTLYGFFVPGVTDDPTARLHLIFLALWVALFVNKRRSLLKAKVQDAKDLPSSSEKN